MNCIFCHFYIKNFDFLSASYKCFDCKTNYYLRNYRIKFIDIQLEKHKICISPLVNNIEIYSICSEDNIYYNEKLILSLNYLTFVSPKTAESFIDKMLNLKAFI